MKSAMKVIFFGLWLSTSVFEMFAMEANINQIDVNGGGEPPVQFYDVSEELYEVSIPQELDAYVETAEQFVEYIKSKITPAKLYTTKRGRYGYVLSHKFDGGNTLLHIAAFKNFPTAVDAILEDMKFYPPDHPLNQKNDEGNTPFHIAAELGNQEFIEKAVAKYLESTIAAHVILGDYEGVCKVIYHLEKNKEEKTALELAVNQSYSQSKENIALDLARGIDSPVPANENGSAVYLAAKNGYHNFLKILQSKNLDNQQFKNDVDKANKELADEDKNKESLQVFLQDEGVKKSYEEQEKEKKEEENLSKIVHDPDLFRKFIQARIGTERWWTKKAERYDYVINHKFSGGNTLLHYAALYNHRGIVDLILNDLKFDSPEKHPLNQKNNDGDTPFHIAAKYGNLEFIEEAVKKYVDNAVLFVPPIKATYHCEKNNAGKTALELAVEPSVFDERREAIAMKFIEEINVIGASLDCIIDGRDKNSVVYFAAKNGYQGVIEALKKNETLAKNKIFTKELEAGEAAVKSLEVSKASLDHFPELTEALKSENAFKKFVEDKIDSEHWYTIKKNRYNYVQNQTFHEGNTLLHYAAQKKFAGVVDLILGDLQFSIQDHPLNRGNDKGNTPFHLAAAQGHVDFIERAVTKYLFAKGGEELSDKPSPNISLRVNYHIQKNNAEKTALELCVENGYEGDYDRHDKQQTCAILLLKGMLMSNLKSIPTFKSGENINSLAIKNGYSDIVHFLRTFSFEILGEPEAVSERVSSGWSPGAVMTRLRSKYDFVKQKYNQGVSTVDSIKKIYAAWKYLQSLKRNDEEERLATQPKD